MASSSFFDGSRENPAILAESDSNEERSPSNLAVDSRDYTAIIPESHEPAEVDASSSSIAAGSRDDPEAIPEPDRDGDGEGVATVSGVSETILGFRKRNEEEERRQEEMRRRWVELNAKRQKTMNYELARSYALDLHSFEIPMIASRNQNKEDEEGEGVKGTSKFQEEIERRKRRKRRDLISSIASSSDVEMDLMVKRTPPLLTELCIRVLADNSDAIKSLHLVPDHLKKKLSNRVSDLSKLNTRFMQLLVQGSPYEISARNCVDFEEKDLTDILSECDGVSLKVLSLDLCGRAMTENSITEFLKGSPEGFPSLTTLSLQGSFCLTDNALALISRSAPLLQLINLSECSLFTSRAVEILADNFGSTLRGLNIGGCQGIKPSNVFKRSLSRFERLNSLSVAGLESVHDVVVEFLTSRGSNLTHLSLASCTEVTDVTILTIGRYCTKLESLDISELYELTDKSLKEITDGCRALNSINLARNRFSDGAVSVFLEVLGGSLNQLCLANVRDVGEDTAISLAKNCKMLLYLDLSWCRKITEEGLKRIMSRCWLLKSLKLFGWTQVRQEFLEELSRSQVNIVGLKMTSIFAHPDDSYPSVDAKFF
ncbi:unnamed protein product [Cochlearia groenlandica]